MLDFSRYFPSEVLSIKFDVNFTETFPSTIHRFVLTFVKRWYVHTAPNPLGFNLLSGLFMTLFLVSGTEKGHALL